MNSNSKITSSTLKWIAITTMIIDHLGAVFFDPDVNGWFLLFRMVGRTAFPLFAFMLTEGFRHTSNLKKYMLRLGIFAIISEVPYDFCESGKLIDFDKQNVFYELLLGLIVLYLINKPYKIKDKDISPIVRVLIIIAGAVIGWVCNFDYHWIGILVIVFLYYIRENFLWYAAGVVVAYAIGADVIVAICVIPALVLIYYYNGKKGRGGKVFKWFFYLFYPVHLGLFGILHYVCGL